MSGANNANRNDSSVNSRRQTESTFPSAIPNNKSAPNSGGNARTRSANATNSFGRSAAPRIKPKPTSHPKQIETILIFALTFLVLGLGRLPGLRIDRTGASVIGAGLMLAIGTLSVDEAWNAIHHDTILLLFGMMILIANLKLSGFFVLAGQAIVRRAHHPTTLLTAIVLATAVLSALFVNDTMCLVMTPLVLEVTLALNRRPLPYLIGVAVASNIGSVATITGNPQNMMIGSYSQIPYAQFFFRLAPVPSSAPSSPSPSSSS